MIDGIARPSWFLLLVAVAVLLVGYVVVQHRKRKHLLRFANLEMLERVAPRRPGWPRHIPIALLLVSLVLLTVSLSGPTKDKQVPRNRASVMLVIDVSLSMQATDIPPSRLKAAQEAAKKFAGDLTKGVNLGLVYFAGTPSTPVQPTTDREVVKKNIDNLKLAEATGTGEAIFAALQAIENFGQVNSDIEGPPPARIVLLTDGKQTVPSDQPDDPRGAFTAARASAEKDIPISTISFGTDYGTVEINGQTVAVAADDESMKEIAQLSGGQFFDANSRDQLSSVYSSLSEQIGYETKRKDDSRTWLIAGTIVAMIAVGGSLALGQRLP